MQVQEPPRGLLCGAAPQGIASPAAPDHGGEQLDHAGALHQPERAGFGHDVPDVGRPLDPHAVREVGEGLDLGAEPLAGVRRQGVDACGWAAGGLVLHAGS